MAVRSRARGRRDTCTTAKINRTGLPMGRLGELWRLVEGRSRPAAEGADSELILSYVKHF